MKRFFVVLVAAIMVFTAAPVFTAADTVADKAAVCEYIAEKLRERAAEIDVSDYSVPVSEISEYMSTALFLASDVFYTEGRASYYKTETPAGDMIVRIMPVYTMTAEETEAAKATFNAMVDEIAGTVPQGLGELETALYLHDYICVNFSYCKDKNNYIYDAYNMLLTRTGVCEAYTKLYNVLLSRFGIRGAGVISDEISHAWNVIIVGGKWYLTDVTWGDPTPDTAGMAKHKYFIRSASFFASEPAGSKGHGDQFKSLYSAADDSMDGHIWHGIDAPFAFSKSGVFAIQDNKIRKFELASGEYEDVYDIGSFGWPAGEGAYWNGTFSGAAAYGDYILYNTPDDIFAYDLTSGEAKKVLTPEIPAGNSLYGCYNFGETLYCVYAGSPNDSGTVMQFDLASLLVTAEPETHTVRFLDFDGTLLAKVECAGGDVPQYPFETPSRGSDGVYSYTFAGWDPQISPAGGDAEYTALYSSEYIDYSVRFLDFDGGIISEATYHYGDEVVPPSAPERPEDDKYTYSFKGWTPAPAAVSGDATYTACYNAFEKAPVITYILGDANGNGVIDAGDYAMTKRHVLGTYVMEAEELVRADINGSGAVEPSEYAMIKRHVLGTFVIEQPSDGAGR